MPKIKRTYRRRRNYARRATGYRSKNYKRGQIRVMNKYRKFLGKVMEKKMSEVSPVAVPVHYIGTGSTVNFGGNEIPEMVSISLPAAGGGVNQRDGTLIFVRYITVQTVIYNTATNFGLGNIHMCTVYEKVNRSLNGIPVLNVFNSAFPGCLNGGRLKVDVKKVKTKTLHICNITLQSADTSNSLYAALAGDHRGWPFLIHKKRFRIMQTLNTEKLATFKTGIYHFPAYSRLDCSVRFVNPNYLPPMYQQSIVMSFTDI